ncbi:MAG: ABC transporter ATP-binding protein [Planctomycetes bacterium]|nr:ABC transporter ATP-binding protein [Planctomycetota bacterium]
MFGVRIENLHMSYGDREVLHGITLEVKPGEMFFVLGPSGCGKSTLLRGIAGLVPSAAGHMFIGETEVTGMPPYMRNTGMVFQNYALFPHLTVGGNVAYGLRLRDVAKDEIADRVRRMLALVGLPGYESRKPAELSGGEQQRVALARAVVVEPQVLLLDEPLSNLDAKLRLKMRRDLKAIQKRLGITTVYVTHDQREALSLADRVAVINDGNLEQTGAPREIYFRPINRFVAGFVGEMNIIQGKVKDVEGASVLFDTPLGTLAVSTEGVLRQGQILDLVFRPEDVQLSYKKGVSGKVVYSAFEGFQEEVSVEVDGAGVLKAFVKGKTSPMAQEGDEIKVAVEEGRIRVFPHVNHR